MHGILFVHFANGPVEVVKHGGGSACVVINKKQLMCLNQKSTDQFSNNQFVDGKWRLHNWNGACALTGLPGPTRHWFTGFAH